VVISLIKYELEPNDENLKMTIESDFLKRNSKLMTFAKILSSVSDNLTISIDGRWGSGKTFFVKQFKYLVEHIDDYEDERILKECDKENFRKLKENNLIVYYNSWQNDMHLNPLESLMYNILNEYPKLNDQILNFEKFKKMFMKFFKDFLLYKSNGLLDIDNFDELKTYSDLSNSIKTIEEKKEAFNNLVDTLLDEKQRLIIIVDELDRCKPTFAVELLETIKHFYYNDKISIIISTNNQQLSNTIKKYYGNDFDGYGYLDKFYDFIITLETEDTKNYLMKQLNFCSKTWIYHDISYLIMDYYNFSLRECNKFVAYYKILKSYIENKNTFNKDKQYINSCIFIPLAMALKIKNIDEYNLFISKKGDKIISDFLDIKVVKTKYESWLASMFNVENSSDFKKTIIDYYHSIFEPKDIYDIIPFFEIISLLGAKIDINDIN